MRQPRIVIVGAGIVGLSTAYALLTQGFQHVTILEQEHVDHARSTSQGVSRLLRFEYGAETLYSEMVRLSLACWKRLERMTKQTLYTRTGLLMPGTDNDRFTRSSYTTMHKLDLPVEQLSAPCCQQRFPQFATEPYNIFTYNTEAGILHASTCLHVLKERILALGGTICESCRVSRVSHEAQYRPIRLFCEDTRNNGDLIADRVVLATGPWVHRLLGELHLPIQMTRQYLLYFAGLPLPMFDIGTFPAFITNDLYGFPVHQMHNGQYWLKAASHTFGPSIDPDETRAPDERFIARTARQLRELIPALQQASLAHVDSCMYDVSPDENFILDRLPDDPRIVFATGLSGHGFKFGPLLGELLASLLCDTTPAVPLDRFQLARFSRQRISVA
ncbi:MAG TPA: FAD-dependent oxidoreductase [Ktedonobacteraceae bacterium]|nr:FAD-dependent oxidoreductase [Ktedonobacteraceae bacterium]